MAEVVKALSALEAPTIAVVKALNYGAVTTDSAALTNGGAFTRSGLAPRHVLRKAQHFIDDTRAGLTPFSKGFAWSDDPVSDVAEYFCDDEGLDDDDAIEVAKAVFTKLGAPEAA